MDFKSVFRALSVLTERNLWKSSSH